MDENAQSATDNAAPDQPAQVPAETKLKEIELDGYHFQVDTDLLDDVEAFEYIDRIENKGQVAGIVPLLTFLIGNKGYADMKAHFAKADYDQHIQAEPADTEYKGRFRIGKLNEVYVAIIEQFDPKG